MIETLREQVERLRDRLRSEPDDSNSQEGQAARKLLTNLNTYLLRTSEGREAQRYQDVTA